METKETKGDKMSKAATLNDQLLPVTPRMERFTVQANAFDAFLSFLPKRHFPTRWTVSIDLLDWMRNNEHDELGNYIDLVEMAARAGKITR